MEWCAAFCAWSLYQGGVSPHNGKNYMCRNHLGDAKYIWSEISCYYWATQLERLERYGKRGSYTPKSGDLIFFNRSGSIGHIGLVVWCDGSTVYTIEGMKNRLKDPFQTMILQMFLREQLKNPADMYIYITKLMTTIST